MCRLQKIENSQMMSFESLLVAVVEVIVAVVVAVLATCTVVPVVATIPVVVKLAMGVDVNMG